VTIAESTQYPFGDGIRLAVSPAKQAAFPLLLRIPAWTKGNAGISISVNGVTQTYEGDAARPRPGSFFRIERTWKPGDVVDVSFEMTVRGSRWFNDSIVLERGPLVYSLDVGQDWRKVTTGMKNPARPPAVDWEVHPTTPWNYALAIDPDRLDASVKVAEGGTVKGAANPFSREARWPTLSIGARRVESWQMVEGSADAPPQSPVTTSGPIETVKLIPYGIAKLRITAFPITRP